MAITHDDFENENDISYNEGDGYGWDDADENDRSNKEGHYRQ